MATSISALSYFDPSAYQSAAVPSALSGPADTRTSGQTSGPAALAQIQAMRRQGNFQAFLNNSVAAALLQPTTAGSNVDSTTLVNSMLQQVLGAYQSDP